MPGSRYPDLDPLDHVTPRQRQILIHLVHGKTREAIARNLYLSRSTVNRDIRDMTRCLGASSPEALGALAYRAGLIVEEHFGEAVEAVPVRI
ncbi:response regulator transcription factor [Glycomyces salinus]|uniref:response regulator transcription factor n=1 Tax=Glycomyces salinus TaxID=980294 RepID=UPI0018ED133A|nr:LuxR C-terminal-related transcriptional regulator [Glycomyces salinus]